MAASQPCWTGLGWGFILLLSFKLTRQDTFVGNIQCDLRTGNHQTMRLSQQTQKIIRDTVQEVFGVEAQVKLFGSRINDDARGGDIDLLVELPSVTAGIERKTMQFIARLQLRIGDQPIDVLVLDPSTPRPSIHEQASLTGIKL